MESRTVSRSTQGLAGGAIARHVAILRDRARISTNSKRLLPTSRQQDVDELRETRSGDRINAHCAYRKVQTMTASSSAIHGVSKI
jgi:hypothetical protein